MRLAWLVLLLIPHVSAFDSGDIRPGETFVHTFTEEHQSGHHYHCHPHKWMAGMVHVMPDTDGAVATHNVDIIEPADADAWGYSIEHLEIEVGDTVVWTNQGTQIHTVTMSEGHDHDHDHGDAGEDAPLPSLGLLLVALLALARR